MAKMAQKLPQMAQKLAPAEKNSTDISAASAAFCISDHECLLLHYAIREKVPHLPRVLVQIRNNSHLVERRRLSLVEFKEEKAATWKNSRKRLSYFLGERDNTLFALPVSHAQEFTIVLDRVARYLP